MSGIEGLKLVDEKPPKILIEKAMEFFGVSEEEAEEYLIDGRKKWNEKHKQNMEKLVGGSEN